MRISNSAVFDLDSHTLFERFNNSSRWNGKIPIKNNKFNLETYVQVEALIDLLDERYTRSDITEVEYDTSVKDKA